MDKQTVYLSGGFHSGWQDHVIRDLESLYDFYDPRKNPSNEPNIYTWLNLEHIDQSDVVLMHMEQTNPGAMNCSFELGYAVSRGKHVVVVFDGRPYADMLLTSANAVFYNLAEAIRYLWFLADIPE